jgi:hypothetical protein
LIRGPFGHHLDVPVGQIANIAGNVVAPSNRARGIAKTHALDVAAVEDLSTLEDR